MSSPPPLTTVFTPQPSCLSASYWIDNLFFSLGPSSTTDCLPSGWGPSTTDYFSPGYCPQGYTIACSSTNTIGTLSETVVTCCPSNYQCQFGPGLAFWQSSHPCGSSFNTLTPTNIVAGSVTGDETIQTTFTSQGGANAGGFNAYSVQVRWQSTDIDILKLLNPNFTPSTTTVSSSSSSLSTTPTLLITTIIVPPTSSSSPTPVPMTGLSTGAKVAIGVGVGIVAFLLLTSLLVIIRRRRHSYKPAATQPPDSLQPHQTYQSLEPKDAISMKPIRHIAEPPSEQGRHELAVSHNSLQSRAELPINDGFRVELPINDESGAVSGRSNPIQFNRLAR